MLPAVEAAVRAAPDTHTGVAIDLANAFMRTLTDSALTPGES